ncbi:hypothetical protein BGZ99_001963, partial [Dissophora globulifera]
MIKTASKTTASKTTITTTTNTNTTTTTSMSTHRVDCINRDPCWMAVTNTMDRDSSRSRSGRTQPRQGTDLVVKRSLYPGRYRAINGNANSSISSSSNQ